MATGSADSSPPTTLAVGVSGSGLFGVADSDKAASVLRDTCVNSGRALAIGSGSLAAANSAGSGWLSDTG